MESAKSQNDHPLVKKKKKISSKLKKIIKNNSMQFSMHGRYQCHCQLYKWVLLLVFT
jgi:hypothetical protein